jgi:lysophospholipase L1-like esterase
MTGALAASLIANIIFLLSARYLYIEKKLLAAEPAHATFFREQNVAERASAQKLIVLFGDSRISQWSPTLSVDGYKIVNRGIAGETTAQMIQRFNADVLGLSPAAVVIEAGINDLVAAGLSAEEGDRVRAQTVEHLKSMVEQAKAANVRVILFTIMPPSEPNPLRRLVWSKRIPEHVARANRELSGLHDPPRVRLLDMANILQSAPGQWRPGMALDTLHFTPAAYRALNTATRTALVED